MTDQSCSVIQSSFSEYLDGAVSGQQMQSIAKHLEQCDDCTREFAALQSLQRSLAMLGPAKPSPNLARRLRVAISHERAESRSRWFDSLSLRWDNSFRPMLVQVSAGLAGTIVLVGGIMLLLGMVAAPEAVMANDEPLGGLTAPHYLYSAEQPHAIITGQDSTIVVEALVDARGRVYDYNIVSGPASEAVRIQVADQLLESVFEPARVFGGPVRGRVIMTFAGISVSG
jgi:anti-sigma factor RsiW